MIISSRSKNVSCLDCQSYGDELILIELNAAISLSVIRRNVSNSNGFAGRIDSRWLSSFKLCSMKFEAPEISFPRLFFFFGAVYRSFCYRLLLSNAFCWDLRFLINASMVRCFQCFFADTSLAEAESPGDRVCSGLLLERIYYAGRKENRN